jgi:hypothetical protein
VTTNYRAQHGNRVTFPWRISLDEGEITLECAAEYDVGDPSVGIWATWFLVDAGIPGEIIMDRDEFRQLFGWQELDRAEDYAAGYARDLADDMRAEASAARDEQDRYDPVREDEW